jgi:hypothetical protein
MASQQPTKCHCLTVSFAELEEKGEGTQVHHICFLCEQWSPTVCSVSAVSTEHQGTP